MRGRAFLLLALLTATALPNAAEAQLRGIIGGITSPFRAMLGRFGHFPHRGHASNGGQPTSNQGAASPSAQFALNCLPAWPDAYNQVLGITFWPDDYAAQFHGRGFDVITDSISGRFAPVRREVRASTTGTAVRDDATPLSDDLTDTQSRWPSDRIRTVVQLTDAQHDALKKLQAAINRSNESIKASCANSRGTAPERLNALVSTLWAVRDAGNAIRGPLQEFYDTLTLVQKQSFATRQPRVSASVANPQMQACATENTAKAERWIKEIEMRVRPIKDQAVSFVNLHKASDDMAKLMIASCAQPVPGGPVARLDAADDQLTTMNYAATTVQIALNDFYAKLDNAQRARFDTLSR
jgi:hypothetical protein